MGIYVVLLSISVKVYNDWYRVTLYQMYSKVFLHEKWINHWLSDILVCKQYCRLHCLHQRCLVHFNNIWIKRHNYKIIASFIHWYYHKSIMEVIYILTYFWSIHNKRRFECNRERCKKLINLLDKTTFPGVKMIILLSVDRATFLSAVQWRSV